MDRRDLVEEALRRHGISDAPRLESHIRGCDLALPVVEATLEQHALFAVWVRDFGTPGKYGAPVDESPQTLGIMMEGRHKEIFRVLKALTVVRCTAASFPLGLVKDVGGWGGGTQYILPPSWLDFVERVS